MTTTEMLTAVEQAFKAALCSRQAYPVAAPAGLPDSAREEFAVSAAIPQTCASLKEFEERFARPLGESLATILHSKGYTFIEQMTCEAGPSEDQYGFRVRAFRA